MIIQTLQIHPFRSSILHNPSSQVKKDPFVIITSFSSAFVSSVCKLYCNNNGGYGESRFMPHSYPWKQQLLKAKQSNKLVVVNFTATWCGPCRAMAPILEELAKEMSNNVIFLKMDVDKLMSVANELRVGALPSFQFFKNGKLVDKFVGARKDVLHDTNKILTE